LLLILGLVGATALHHQTFARTAVGRTMVSPSPHLKAS
jgi:hypothetical protein